MLRVTKKDLKPARVQDTDSADDDSDDDLGIEEAEESDDDEAETGETGESDVQTDDDSKARVGVEAVGKELPGASDGGMDDEAMFRMDSYLAQIFKEKKNQAGGETAHSQLELFKLQVLSLLEIYLQENQASPKHLLTHILLRVASSLASIYGEFYRRKSLKQSNTQKEMRWNYL